MDDRKTINQKQMDRLQETLKLLRAAKPEDRSEEARRYAVAITELEKVVAYFNTFVIENAA